MKIGAQEKEDQAWTPALTKLVDDLLRLKVSEPFWIKPKLLQYYPAG